MPNVPNRNMKVANRHIIRFTLSMMILGMILPALNMYKLAPRPGEIMPREIMPTEITTPMIEGGVIEGQFVPEEVKYSLSPQNNLGIIEIPPVFLKTMPLLSDMNSEARKQIFVQIMLPLILYANEEILKQRAEVQNAYAQKNRAILEKYAQIYRVKWASPPNEVPNGVSDEVGEVGPEKLPEELPKELLAKLLVKIAPIPIPIALAQAATESGWGQSRFAQQGNALFGQWVWNDAHGIKAKNPSDKRASVRQFPHLLASVQSYMLNLNRLYAYEEFRNARLKYHENPENQTYLDATIEGLLPYSEKGRDYVHAIKILIKQNKFNRLTQAELIKKF